jgi:nucleotide-binding universal stress UspA family protein
MLPHYSNEVLTESLHIKKFLIAIDFKDYAENTTNVFLNFLRGIPSEFTFFHSLESGLSKEEAELKMTNFVQKLSQSSYNRPYFSYKTSIFEADATSAIEILHNAYHFDLVIIGSSNDPTSKMLGDVAKKIFLDVQANFLIVPPQAEIKQLQNVSILLEDSLEALPLMNAFRRYLKCQDVFINLVLCRKNQELDNYSQSLIKNYQTFFSENYAFPIIFEYDDLVDIVCEKNAPSMVDFFGICWDESTKLFRSLSKNNFEVIPSFTKIPLFVSKEKQLVEVKEILEEICI